MLLLLLLDVVANTGEFYRNFVEKGYLYSEFDVHGEHAMVGLYMYMYDMYIMYMNN